MAGCVPAGFGGGAEGRPEATKIPQEAERMANQVIRVLAVESAPKAHRLPIDKAPLLGVNMETRMGRHHIAHAREQHGSLAAVFRSQIPAKAPDPDPCVPGKLLRPLTRGPLAEDNGKRPGIQVPRTAANDEPGSLGLVNPETGSLAKGSEPLPAQVKPNHEP